MVTNQKTNDGRTNTNTNTKSEVADDDDDQVNQRLIWSRQFHRPQFDNALLSTHYYDISPKT